MNINEELDVVQERLEVAVHDGRLVDPTDSLAAITTLRARVAELECRAQDAELFLDNAVSKSSEPLRDLGKWLAELLDEDQWPKAERLLNTATVAEAELARLRQGVQVSEPMIDAAFKALHPDTRDFIGPGEMQRVLEAAIRAALVSPGEVHSDDLAVDRFAAAMKAKLAKKRADGRGGWEGPDCNDRYLSRLLREHVEKGDPLDVGNLAMMLHQRGERIVSPGDGATKYAHILSLLKRLEWSGARKGPSSAMHLDNGDVFNCCPICHGLQPGRGAEGQFIKQAIGHREGCDLEAAIRAALVSPGDGWRSMDSAPKDGTRFWAYEARRGCYECWWQNDLTEWEGWQDDWDCEPEPTAWMPLPAPPASEGGADHG